MKIRFLAVALVAAVPLSACAADDMSRIEEVSQIRYTGDTKTDLISLCKVGSLLNGLDNTQSALIQDAVVDLSHRFADTSDPNTVSVLNALELVTSTDQNLRAEGEKVLDTVCSST